MNPLRRTALSSAAAAGLGLGCWVVVPAAADVGPTPAFPALLRLTGPCRGLPVPFLWSAWGRARARYDTRAGAALGQWLSWLLPERAGLFRGFAWELAYDATALETDPAVEARLLRDALDLLDQGQRLHPHSFRFAFDANFMLLDLCLRGPDTAALRAAFEDLAGVDALELADRYAVAARQLAPGVPLNTMRVALTRELLGLRALEEGRLQAACAAFAASARRWQSIDPDRASRLDALARQLPAGPAALSEDLRTWVEHDGRLGRDAALWQRR